MPNIFTANLRGGGGSLVIHKPAVSNFAALAITYPTPGAGWTVTTSDNGYSYVYSTESNQWVLASTATVPPATATVEGIVKLTTSTVSTSTDTAATPASVKAAYDLAASKLSPTGSASLLTDFPVLNQDTTGTASVADALSAQYIDWNATSGGSSIANKPVIPTQYTDEMAQDAIAPMLTTGPHTGISFTYNDSLSKLLATVNFPAAGDMTGPANSVDSDIAVFNGTSGKQIKSSGKKVTDFAASNHNHFGLYAPALIAGQNYINDAEKSNLHAPHSDDQDLSLYLLKTATEIYTTEEKTKLAELTVGGGGSGLTLEQAAMLHAPHSDDQDLTNFVTKISGKSLSTEDYTTAEKAKLAAITGLTPEQAALLHAPHSDDQTPAEIAAIITSGTHSGISYSYANGKLNSTVIAAGSGDVTGPASSVNTNIVTFNGTTGKILEDSGKKLSDFVARTDTENFTLAEKTKLSGLTPYTDEQVQDVVGSMLTTSLHTGIQFVYDDNNNQLNATVTGTQDLSNYVVKEVGKGLSTEDYSTAEKTKLAGLAPQVQADWNQYNNTLPGFIQNKPTIPTQYTDEQAQDAAASILLNGTHSGISFAYDTVNNKMNATASGGGGGSAITRYEAGAGTGCYVLATGPGVVITKTGNTATFSTPAGVQIISASIHFTSTDIGAATAANIDFGINQGCGDNSDYTTMFAPQFQVWADVSGNRAYRATAVCSLNVNSHNMLVAGLVANMAIWVNVSF